jgi:hypothetical protein
VFENRVLRRMLVPKRNEVIRGRRKLHNDKLHNFSSPSIIGVIKSKKIKWAEHTEHMERKGIHIAFWWKIQKEKHNGMI